VSASLDGAVALVTGGAGGIGAATCRLLAREGATVVVADVATAAAAAVVEQIRESGGDAVAAEMDVTSVTDVASTIGRTLASLGRLDVVVNNAGVAQQHTVRDGTVEQWRRVLETNLIGTFVVTQHAAGAMTNGGAIVNIASVAAVMGVRETGAYAAAKGGVVAFTRVAAVELAPSIRVNCICPGTVLTAMPADLLRSRGGGDLTIGAALTARRYLLDRLGEPEEIAETAVFLASPRSSFITGAVLVADGGVSAQ
jgi:NAD(P)-dependent dehydrogenase (short-subunit alcohol dehydrogenase family)